MPPQGAIQTVTSERRKRDRLPLRLTIYLSRSGDSHQYESRTRDISSAGFYCLLPVPVAPGETLDCYILLPPYGRDTHQNLCLQCTAKVVRIEQGDSDGRFGVGCYIEEYFVRSLEDLN